MDELDSIVTRQFALSGVPGSEYKPKSAPSHVCLLPPAAVDELEGWRCPKGHRWTVYWDDQGASYRRRAAWRWRPWIPAFFKWPAICLAAIFLGIFATIFLSPGFTALIVVSGISMGISIGTAIYGYVNWNGNFFNNGPWWISGPDWDYQIDNTYYDRVRELEGGGYGG